MTIESLSLWLLLWIAVVVLAAGLVQGMLGFGFAFVATPLIALASDMRTAIVAVLLPTLAAAAVAVFASGALRATLARFWMMPLYQMLGAAAGTWLFVAAPELPYLLVLAAVTLLYLNLDRLSPVEWPVVRRHERRFAPLSAVTSGFFDGTANVAAPPLIIYYLALGLAPGAMVQAMNICFLVGKSTQFIVLTARGGVGAAQWLETIPFAVIGAAASFTGARLRGRIDAPTYRAWVKRALYVISIALLAQYAWSRLS
ncbi:MAG: sulfite exporter TauE/SafE family protein [Burkholderiales bacterium]|nr:sulfite exporter TauE/SafE family protein [Burkholderiales bacterium]